MERMKHYLSICNSGPSEKLTMIALRNRETILARNCAIIDANLVHLNAFFARHKELFDWQQPDASCMAYPRYNGTEGVEEFVRSLIEDSSLLLLPGSIYASALTESPQNHFRIGFGRRGMEEGIAVLEQHIERSGSRA